MAKLSERALYMLLTGGTEAHAAFESALGIEGWRFFPTTAQELARYLLDAAGEVRTYQLDALSKTTQELRDKINRSVEDYGESLTPDDYKTAALNLKEAHTVHAAKGKLQTLLTSTTNPTDIQTGLEEISLSLDSDVIQDDLNTSQDVSNESLDNLDALQNGDKARFFLPTGFNGWVVDKGEINGMGGEAGVGKTQLAAQVAHNVARMGKRVFYGAYEMQPWVMQLRLASAMLGINYEPILDGTAERGLYERFKKCIREELAQLPIVWNATRGLTVSQVISRINRAARLYGEPELVVLDYSELISPDDNAGGDEVRRVKSVLESLKTYSGTRKNTAFLVIVPLNRDRNSRYAMPRLKDIKYYGDYTFSQFVVPFAPNDIDNYNATDVKKMAAFAEFDLVTYEDDDLIGQPQELNRRWLVFPKRRYGQKGVLSNFMFTPEIVRWSTYDAGNLNSQPANTARQNNLDVI